MSHKSYLLFLKTIVYACKTYAKVFSSYGHKQHLKNLSKLKKGSVVSVDDELGLFMKYIPDFAYYESDPEAVEILFYTGIRDIYAKSCKNCVTKIYSFVIAFGEELIHVLREMFTFITLSVDDFFELIGNQIDRRIVWRYEAWQVKRKFQKLPVGTIVSVGNDIGLFQRFYVCRDKMSPYDQERHVVILFEDGIKSVDLSIVRIVDDDVS
jgi:hypothetical protein